MTNRLNAALANAQKCKELLNDYATGNSVEEDEFARVRTAR